MAIDIDIVKKLYSFEIEDNPENKKIQYLNFKDGTRYKIQHPSVMEIHILIHDSENPETSLFARGIQTLYPANDKSPKIDEEYLEANPNELEKWSLIVRGVLSQRWTKIQPANIPEKLS